MGVLFFFETLLAGWEAYEDGLWLGLHLATLMYYNLCSKMNLSLSCHTPLTTFHIFFYHHMSPSDGAQRIPSSIFIWLSFFLSETWFPFCHQPPAQLNPPQKPFDVSLHISPSKLWNLNFLIRAASICQEILFIDLREIELHELQ